MARPHIYAVTPSGMGESEATNTGKRLCSAWLGTPLLICFYTFKRSPVTDAGRQGHFHRMGEVWGGLGSMGSTFVVADNTGMIACTAIAWHHSSLSNPIGCSLSEQKRYLRDVYGGARSKSGPEIPHLRYLPSTDCTVHYRLADALHGMGDTAVTLTDTMIALLLAAKIHGTDKAVRATAKRCAQALPRSQRDLIFSIVNSKEPLKHITRIAENLDLD